MSAPTRLQTGPRAGTGSRASRKDRLAGRVPVNIYGHGQPNACLTVDAHALSMALRTTDQVFTLDIAGQDESCLVREVQYDTFGQDVLHIDFTRIDLSEQVSVEVALRFTGHAVGVAAGGQQVIHHNTLSVRCRADAIPESISIDITEIEIGHSIHAGEVSLPEGVVLDEIHLSPEDPVIGVAAARVEAEPEAEEGAVEGETPEGEEGEQATPAEGEQPKKDEG